MYGFDVAGVVKSVYGARSQVLSLTFLPRRVAFDKRSRVRSDAAACAPQLPQKLHLPQSQRQLAAQK